MTTEPYVVRTMTVIEARRDLIVCRHGATEEHFPAEAIDRDGNEAVPGARVIEWSDGRRVLEGGAAPTERTVTLPSEPETEQT